MQDDIIGCQKRGKVLTISLGGATGGVGFQSDDQAESFADTIWNLFLGGSSNMRPFGSAILDGYVNMQKPYFYQVGCNLFYCYAQG